jgi:hypothetical protein
MTKTNADAPLQQQRQYRDAVKGFVSSSLQSQNVDKEDTVSGPTRTVNQSVPFSNSVPVISSIPTLTNNKPADPDLSAIFDLTGAHDNLSPQEVELITQALLESTLQETDKGLQQQQSTSPPHCSDAHHNGISEIEAVQIEKALREADLADQQQEEMKSLQLAIQIAQQQQDNSVARRSWPQGNVRTMTRAEFEREAGGSKTEPTATVTTPLDYYDAEDLPPAAGFRMNSTVDQEWNRRDQSSVVGPNNEIRTKHDVTLNAQSNAHRLGLEDYGGAKVGNQAYNSFLQSTRRNKKGVAAHGTGRAGADAGGTKNGALDPGVRLVISRAINSGIIERCNGVVKEGKEAVVYHADMGENSDSFDVAVKVFKRIQEFKGRADYVHGDPRYSRENFRKASTRKQLEMWAEKEYRNLCRANKAGVPVPTPLEQKENILLMRFFGTDGWPAPQLRELDLRHGSKRWNVLYMQIMEAMRL